MALEGRFDYKAHELPMEAYRDWRLMSIGGGPPSKYDNESAVRLDWILAVDDAVKQAEANIERRRNGG